MDWEVVGLFVLLAKVVGETLAAAAAWSIGLFSLSFSLVSIAAAYRFFRLRRRPAVSAQTPPSVTILKPIKGLDRDLAESLRSFCLLDYPCFQLLFTLSSSDDPALPALESLKKEFPRIDIGIVVSKSRIGFNPKINNLSNAAPLIKHPLILMSDSDVKVRPDFLRRMVACLEDPGTGLVTCFYQSTTPRGLWARLEALSVNAQFLPQAVTAAAFGMRFAMGAAILVRRELFESVGGFALMADHLADDFVLGEAVRSAGFRLAIADCVVDSTPDLVNGIEHLRHQARWARTIRLCRPAGYLGTVMLHGFSLLTLKVLLFGPDRWSLALLAALWAAKGAAQLAIARLAGCRQSSTSALLIPLSDWVAFGAWLSGFRATQVLWRGELYTVETRGKLVPVLPRPPKIATPAAAD
ncbi:MAG: bacteriohopanetetrol glucosamine biosynthesis glycosyltransferase HpnI [Elusimicrobia bacterium]|nr:bacteriohopanetetrol glucosamine biosynthesis glycosyltransferase HpnI [Elusimicrobiota bacterium]